MKTPLFIIFLLSLSIDLTASGQSAVRIETDLHQSFQKIGYWYEKKGDPGNAYDSLTKSNDKFAYKLAAYTNKYPFTLRQNFPLLKNDRVDISSSTDGMFRIYSWDTMEGGTMHIFENVFQYNAGDKTTAILDTPKEDGEYGPSYVKVYTFKASGKTYYLATYLTIGSTRVAGQGIQVFDIENGKLNDDVKLIKTKSGLHSQLSFGFDSFSEVDWKIRPEIYFNSDLKTINLPLIDGDNKMTHQYIVYKFDGQYFERVKN
ncbi:MAG TPA: hypothetical protein VFE53_13565 [Mucilaginibacter sp.]|jgi:hypothetical protein|nr:hypothetical protein [Mucilaginibacter sp.]